jgi:putative sterol carrier protein
MTETQTVEQIFSEMEGKFRSDKAQGLTATFQFNITGDGGGEWNAAIVDGNATLNQGTADSPNVTITASSDDWIKIVSGSMNPQMAFMTGKLKVQGDLGLATKLQTLFL